MVKAMHSFIWKILGIFLSFFCCALCNGSTVFTGLMNQLFYLCFRLFITFSEAIGEKPLDFGGKFLHVAFVVRVLHLWNYHFE